MQLRGEDEIVGTLTLTYSLHSMQNYFNPLTYLICLSKCNIGERRNDQIFVYAEKSIDPKC